MKAFMSFIKPFEARQRSVKIKNLNNSLSLFASKDEKIVSKISQKYYEGCFLDEAFCENK